MPRCRLLWYMHALRVQDWYLAALNVVGVLAGCVQLSMLLLYPSRAEANATSKACKEASAA